MRILVTGSQGFLGQHIVTALAKYDVKVFATGRRAAEGVLGCDLTKPDEVSRLIMGVSPDCIIHCAAHVPADFKQYQDKKSAQISLSMLTSILAASKCRVVYASSMSVYGSNSTPPVSEEDAVNSDTEYGKGKLDGEGYIAQARRPGISVRLPGLFGLPRKGGLVYNLLSALKCERYIELPKHPTIWAAMHVSDAAESMAKLSVMAQDHYEIINLGYSGVYSIDRLIKMASEIYECNIDYDLNHPGFEFNLTRAKRYSVAPSCSLMQALIRFGHEI